MLTSIKILTFLAASLQGTKQLGNPHKRGSVGLKVRYANQPKLLF
ncbi:hypothetical protein [Geitlerinema sp. PCC 9228]|nr:hypothetical protein [Geitlerinema sp. PCC 9228]